MEFQTHKRLPHRGSQEGCIGPLDLQTNAATAVMNQQIQHGAAMSDQEQGSLRSSDRPEQPFDHESLSGSAQPAMAVQGILGGDLEQLMQQARVAEVDLEGLRLAFDQVGVSGGRAAP
jgi:hypothetical protein